MDDEQSTKDWASGFKTGFVTTLVAAMIIGGLVTLWHRDAEATERCIQIGGQTWDEGHHCVIGGKVVSTR